MPRLSIKLGCITMTVKHLIRRSSGAFYYRRGIPFDLRDFYKGKREHVYSLQTHHCAYTQFLTEFLGERTVRLAAILAEGLRTCSILHCASLVFMALIWVLRKIKR